jgi:hypothetical protein
MVGHIACMGEAERTSLLVRPRIRWRILLKCTLEKLGGNMWTGFICLRIGTSGGFVNPVMNLYLTN